MSAPGAFIATCPKGVEPLLAAELRDLGAADVRETRAAVTFGGDLPSAYRVCLWSRLASRVLMELAGFPAETPEELYAGVADVAWADHVSPDGTLAVDATGTTTGLTHTGFAARTVKDAVVDRLRERYGRRPSVDLEHPDVRLNLRLRSGRGALSLDLSGEPLHRRGYRAPGEQVEAPLKENLAAAVLVRADWPRIALDGGSLLDPMCGSGTLLVEGALIAGDRAPGLLRERWGFLGWLGHAEDAWSGLLAEADQRAEAGRVRIPRIEGWDRSHHAVEIARACVRRAGLDGVVRVDQRELVDFSPPEDAGPGLVVTNPPYGVRLGEVDELGGLYALLGERLLAGFEGWTAALFTAEDSLARATGLRSRKAYTLYNGAVATKLYLFDVARGRVKHEVRTVPAGVVGAPDGSVGAGASPGAGMFANRLRKNVRHRAKWARRLGVTCYRIYDADLPEYAVAIDLYEGAGASAGRVFAHVQEYAPPPTVDPGVAQRRLAEAVDVVAEVLGIGTPDVVVKVRSRQRGRSQYERHDERGEFVEVAEGGLRFLVNPTDYLDVGLFLDHRPTRALVRDLATGRRFCNLFAYTGTASAYAAAGGATSTTTVDMSGTYLGWARRNMELNGFAEGEGHRFVQADALEWIGEEAGRISRGEAGPYGLVFLDPPTFSNSKRMGGTTFDVQRDHPALLRTVAELLAEDGVLIFSTNARRFVLNDGGVSGLDVEDITRQTIPEDFARNRKTHASFILKKSSGRDAT